MWVSHALLLIPLVVSLLVHGGVHQTFTILILCFYVALNLFSKNINTHLSWILIILSILCIIQLVSVPLDIHKELSPNLYAKYECLAVNKGEFSLSVDRDKSLIGWSNILMILLATYAASGLFKKYGANKLFLFVFVLGFVEAYYGIAAYLFQIDSFPIFGKRLFKDFTTGSFVNRNHFGFFTAVTALLGIYHCVSEYKGVLFGKSAQKFLLYFVMTLTIIIALILSKSRGAFISLIVGIIIFSFLISGKSKGATTILVMLAAVLSFMLIWLGNAGTLSRGEDLVNENMTGRLGLWRNSINVITDYPLLGTGPGGFEFAFEKYNNISGTPARYSHPHNEYLSFMTDFGLPVGISIICFILVLLMKGYQMTKSSDILRITIFSMLIISLVNFLFDFNLRIPSNAILFSLIAGYLVVDVSREALKLGKVSKGVALAASLFMVYTYSSGRVESSPLDYKSLVNKGRIEWGAGNISKAKQFFDCSFNISPYDQEVLFYRTLFYYKYYPDKAYIKEVRLTCEQYKYLFESLGDVDEAQVVNLLAHIGNECIPQVLETLIKLKKEILPMRLVNLKQEEIIGDHNILIQVGDILDRFEYFDLLLHTFLAAEGKCSTFNCSKFIVLAYNGLGERSVAEGRARAMMVRYNDAESYLLLAKIYSLNNKKLDSLRVYELALEKFADNRKVLLECSRYYKERGLLTDSARTYLKYFRIARDESRIEEAGLLLEMLEPDAARNFIVDLEHAFPGSIKIRGIKNRLKLY